jgi:hypothetical protein
MITPTLAAALLAGVEIRSQHLDVALEPANHRVAVTSRIELRGEGPLRLRLTDLAEIEEARLDDAEIDLRRRAGDDEAGLIELEVGRGARALTLRYSARFEQDVAAGEQPGAIHNFSVDAHVGPEGVFLSDGSAWHPRPIDDDGRFVLHAISVSVEPIDAW